MAYIQSVPSACGLVVFGVSRQAEQGFHLAGRAHDLVKVNIINRRVLFDVIRQVRF